MQYIQKKILNHWEKIAKTYADHDVLQRRVSEEILLRLRPIKFHAQKILELGAGYGYLSRKIHEQYPKAELFILDLILSTLKKNIKQKKIFRKLHAVIADANALPIASNSMDLVIGNLLIDCIPKKDFLIEINRVLKPGGLLILSAYGPDTLKELRHAFASVDEIAHVNSFLDIHDLGEQIAAQGFSHPILDVNHYQLIYPSVEYLLKELKGFGSFKTHTETHPGLMGKEKFSAMKTYYQQTFSHSDKIAASFEVVFAHAFKKIQQNKNVDNEFSIDIKDIVKRI